MKTYRINYGDYFDQETLVLQADSFGDAIFNSLINENLILSIEVYEDSIFNLGDTFLTKWFNNTDDYTHIVAMDEFDGIPGFIEEIRTDAVKVHGYWWPI